MPHTPYAPEDLKPLLAGVVNMHCTAFDETGSLDEAALCTHTHFMLEHGLVAGRGVQIVGRHAGQAVGAGERLPLRRPGPAQRAQLRPLMAQAGLSVAEADG